MPRTGIKNKQPLHKWTEEELDFIRTTYPTYDRNVTLKLLNERFNLNITKDQFKSTIDRYKITCGRKTHYQNGTTPYNKGKKWDEWMPKESQNNSLKTTFKAAPIGSELLTKEGYIYVKVDKHTYRPKHHLVWEAVNGAIPEGHKILFIDGDRQNFDINNLALVTSTELITINSNQLYFKGNVDATKCGVTLSKLIIRGRELAKKHAERLE